MGRKNHLKKDHDDNKVERADNDDRMQIPCKGKGEGNRG